MMPRSFFYRSFCLLGAGAALLIPHTARADDPSWDMQLSIESDVRFRLETKAAGSLTVQDVLPAGVERNQNALGAKFAVSWENVRAVAQTDLVLYGFQQEINGVGGLSEADELQPYRVDVNELYVEVSGLFVDQFTLRVGQQIVAWGVADQFNPTNLLNSDDLLDPLLFGKQQGNFMVKGDFWVTDDFSLTGVLVPVFKAARLPTSTKLGLAQADRIPFVDENIRWRLIAERGAASQLLSTPTYVDEVTTRMPDTTFGNMQAGFRMEGAILEQDVALSYYRGRNDFPVPISNSTGIETQTRCADRPLSNICSTQQLRTDVVLGYPEMHAYGLNLAGEFNPFSGIDPNIGGIGYRLEAALFVPERTASSMYFENISLAGRVLDGEYDYDGDGRAGGKRPLVVDDTPFAKWTLGLDYTFPANVYVNLMWVHGLADEFGAGDFFGGTKEVRKSGVVTEAPDTVSKCVFLPNGAPPDGSKCAREILRPRLGDYLVAGVDVRWLDDQLLTRLFALFELSGYEESSVDPRTDRRTSVSYPFYSPEGFAASIFPEASYNFGNGLELSAGALINLGESYTKFGDPAAGGSLGFMRARYTL